MIKKILKSPQSVFVTVSFLFVTLTTVAVYINDTTDIKWLRMIWNYFLAVIPVYMALLSKYFSDLEKRVPAVVFSLLWLLFFPNAFYMLTDFKYISKINFPLWDIYTVVGSNLTPWILLTNLVISITAGVISAIISLEIIHKLLEKNLGKKISWAIVSLLMILTSFGVYIGRFARLNSWDIVNLEKLYDDIMS
ncbi:MAG: DUF1361 domain-containing protein, partial [Ruminococcus sp.]